VNQRQSSIKDLCSGVIFMQFETGLWKVFHALPAKHFCTIKEVPSTTGAGFGKNNREKSLMKGVSRITGIKGFLNANMLRKIQNDLRN
jgi:hypothetical protein